MTGAAPAAPALGAPTLPAAAEAAPPPTPAPSGTQACVVTLGGRVFAFEITAVREVAEFDDLTAVPLAPPHVLGVANLRGDVVPVVDPSAALGLPAEAPGRRLRTLVVAADGLSAALRVDAVAGLEVLETSAVGPAAPWARAALEREGHPIPLVDAGALLAGLRPAERREA